MLIRIVTLEVPNKRVGTEDRTPEEDLPTCQVEKVTILMVVLLVSVIEFSFNHNLGSRWGDTLVKYEVRNRLNFTINCSTKASEKGCNEVWPIN